MSLISLMRAGSVGMVEGKTRSRFSHMKCHEQGSEYA